MAKYIVEDIFGVLDYGVPISRPAVLKWLLPLPLVFPFITLGMAITVWCGVMSWDSEMTTMMIGMNVCAAIILGIVAYMIIRDKRLKANIAEWLTDAVEVDAKITRLYPENPRIAKLEVAFMLNGEQVCIKSTTNIFKQSRNTMFALMGDCNKLLLYSQKYNRVLFTCEDTTED